MKKIRKKKRSSEMARLFKKLSKKLFELPANPNAEKVIAHFFVYNKKTGYYEPTKH